MKTESRESSIVVMWVVVTITVSLLVAMTVASGSSCVTVDNLQTCRHLIGRCLHPQLTPSEASALGIDTAQHDTAALILALDRRIGEALDANVRQPGFECKNRATFFLCARHLHVPQQAKRFPECGTACMTYVSQCADGRTIDWPLRYGPCADYTQECMCLTTLKDGLANGRCRQLQ